MTLAPNKLLKFVLLIVAGNFLSIQTLQAQQHIYPPEKPLWDADSLGNQRAVIKVETPLKTATITINWRNRNVTADQKVFVVDSTTNELVKQVEEIAMGPEKGTIAFKAENKGIYYVYYLPFRLKGSPNYPNAEYKTIKNDEKVPLSGSTSSRDVSVLRMEAVNQFNSNTPMEVIATKTEIAGFEQALKNQAYAVFPEKREFPIKMKQNLPKKWVQASLPTSFKDTVPPGENFTFQLGIWAFKADLNEVKINFSDLKDESGNTIPADSLNCFNTEGVDYTGRPFTKTVGVQKGFVKAFWCGVQIPTGLPVGNYVGKATITTKNNGPTPIDIQLNVKGKVAQNHGIDKPWLQTRLTWLNSTMAQKNTVIAPYAPLKVSGNSISLLGRKLILGKNGLPEQIQTFFTEEMTDISSEAKNILDNPFRFNIIDQTGNEINLKTAKFAFKEQEEGTVTWTANNTAQQLDMQVSGELEFDGHANFEVKIIAQKDLKLNDIALQIPFNDNAAKYMLGLGHKGGKRPEDIDWKWDVAHKNQDGFWLGDVNAGMQVSLRDQNYERPLNTNFYLQKPLILPTSWGNGNKGGIKIAKNGTTVTANNYSGPHSMKKGDTLYYNFTLLITPFHTLNTDWQWKNRFFHAYKPIDTVKESGANIVNIHHGNEINPYINYPFIATKEMKAYIDSAHAAGLKVKIYNTIREVSNRLYELYPIKNLDHEIFSSGDGGGYSWLQEHLDNDYIAAWFVPKYKDAAIINSGMNRWHNYYVEGTNWLVQNIGIDGIYLDDVAFDRITMKRTKRVLTQNGHPGIIDLHSANQYNERDGFNNSANLYMEHFPYLDRLWFGEYFDYEQGSPGFFLTEVSGIPFGLMGEMLQDGGNPWRGMVYGMTNRMPYQELKPDHIWKAWDDFGMQGTQMIGYWVSDNPVKTNNEDVLATVYKKSGKAMVSIASWAPQDTNIKLQIDWDKLGIDPKKATLSAPEIKNFQPAHTFSPNDEIPVKKNEGWLLIIE